MNEEFQTIHDFDVISELRPLTYQELEDNCRDRHVSRPNVRRCE